MKFAALVLIAVICANSLLNLCFILALILTESA